VLLGITNCLNCLLLLNHAYCFSRAVQIGQEPTPHASRKMIRSKDLLKLNQIKTP